MSVESIGVAMKNLNCRLEPEPGRIGGLLAHARAWRARLATRNECILEEGDVPRSWRAAAVRTQAWVTPRLILRR